MKPGPRAVTMPEQSPPGGPGSPGYMSSTFSTSRKLRPMALTASCEISSKMCLANLPYWSIDTCYCCVSVRHLSCTAAILQCYTKMLMCSAYSAFNRSICEQHASHPGKVSH